MTTKLFRGCRYEVRLHVPGEAENRLWSRHHSHREAQRSYRSLRANGIERGEIVPGTLVELRDHLPGGDGATFTLESARVQS
jgi:hypothetical protein